MSLGKCAFCGQCLHFFSFPCETFLSNEERNLTFERIVFPQKIVSSRGQQILLQVKLVFAVKIHNHILQNDPFLARQTSYFSPQVKGCFRKLVMNE